MNSETLKSTLESLVSSKILSESVYSQWNKVDDLLDKEGSEINIFLQLLNKLGLDLRLSPTEEDFEMTIQWKKLINFDVPQKLWDLAEKIANERGWTTEAVLCDAAEKYLGYIGEDPNNEMISIQIPKSLYDRIETVGNKSVEREIQREMTEWVELVEEIYEESEEEEPLEPLLPPVSNVPKESTQHYLVKYESNWADEMDIEGFDILTQEDKDYFESLTPTDDKPLIYYVGTNEEIEYWDSEMFLSCYTWTPITQEEAETVKRLFNPSYGHFFYPEINDEEGLEDDD